MLANLVPPYAEAPDSGPTWQELVDGWELFRDPIYAAVIAGAVLGYLSVYVVLRRMVFVSAAVTQGAGLGVALSFYAGIHWGWDIHASDGGIVVSTAIALLLAVDPRRTGMSREELLGLAFALTAGAAILVGSRITQEAHDIQAILFGTAVMVFPEDLSHVEDIGAIVMIIQLWWYRGFTFASFDPVAARVQKLPVALLDAVMLLSIGFMVGASARALGSLPVFALSTLPGAAALLLVRRNLPAVFVTAAVLGAAIGGGGYLVAFFRDYPVGATQTVLAGLVVVTAAVISRIVLLILRLRR